MVAAPETKDNVATEVKEQKPVSELKAEVKMGQEVVAGGSKDESQDNKVTEEKALELLAAGKKALILNKAQDAVDKLADACRMMSTTFGEVSPKLCDFYYHYGRALIELSRIEEDVLGNALKGVPADGDELESSQVEDPEKMTEEEKESVAKQVDEALEENFKTVEELKEKSSKPEDSEKDSKSEDSRTDDSKSEDSAKEAKSEDSKSEDAKKEDPKSEDTKKDLKSEETKKDSKSEDSKSEDTAKESKSEDSKSEGTKKDSKSEDSKVEESKTEETKSEESKTEDSEEKMETEEKEENGKAENEGEEKDGEEEEGEDEEAEGEEGESQDESAADSQEESGEPSQEEEEVSSLQLAWEVLEVAKNIHLKNEKRSVDENLQLAQIYLKLAEVTMENEMYPESIQSNTSCLEIQKPILKADDRRLAETLYQLGLAYSLDDKYDESLKQFQAAIEVIETRIKNNTEKLSKDKITVNDELDTSALTDEQKSVVTDTQELKVLLPQLTEKIDDIKETKANFTEKIKAMKALKQEILKSAESSTSSAFGEAPSSSSTEAKPISSTLIVRKKRKPEEEASSEESSKKQKTEEGSKDAPLTNGNAKEEEEAEKKEESAVKAEEKKVEKEEEKMETDEKASS